MTKVTIITATTGSDYLKKNLESVASQTYKNIQHLVVVDGEQHLDKVAQILQQEKHNVDLVVLPYATGIALAKKKLGYGGQVFVIMSDGELDEGTTWESALFAQHNNLCNLTVIVDRNFLQSLESTESTLSLEPLDEKFRSFNWEVETIDGHDHIKLINVLSKTQLKPKLIIAETIKGKGVSFMENEVKWHYKSPNQEEFEKALKEIENMDTL